MKSKDKHQYQFILSLSLFLFVRICFGENHPDVSDILNGYNIACRWSEKVSMRIHTEVNSNSDISEQFTFTKLEYIHRRNNNKADWIGNTQLFEDSNAKFPKIEDEHMFVFNGKEIIVADKRSGRDKIYRGTIQQDNYDKILNSTFGDYYYGGFLLGYIGEMGSLAQLFNRSNSVRFIRQEQINGTTCYLLEDIIDKTIIKVWIAPDKGYNALKIALSGITKNWRVQIDTIEFKKINDNSIPVSGRFEKTNIMEDGSEKTVCVKTEFSNIDLNPDFEALGAFELRLPEGSLIIDREHQGIKYHISGGKLIPDIIEPKSLLDKPLLDIDELVKINNEKSNTTQKEDTQTEPTVQLDEPEPLKSFLTAEEILTEWEKSYGGIKTMKVSYRDLLVDYKPPADEPNSSPPIKYIYVERTEGRVPRYHMRHSFAKDGFERPDSIKEYAYDGKIGMEYLADKKYGTIFPGLTGTNAETENALKSYMLLKIRHSQSELKKEYPDGMQEFIFWFKLGMLYGKVTVRPYLEPIAGQSCHVVEIGLPEQKTGPVRYKHVFWMAQDKGMCVMKYQWWDNQKTDSYKLDIETEILEIAKTNMNDKSIWYPKKSSRTLYGNEGHLSKRELTVEEFIPNIKVDENTFTINFPLGTDVYDRLRNISYTVTSEQPQSLLDKHLPDINEPSTNGDMDNNYQQNENKFPKTPDKESQLDAIELLNKYAQNQDKLNSSVIVKFVCQGKGYQDNKVDVDRIVPSEVRIDGKRIFNCVNHFIDRVKDKNVPLDEMDLRNFQM